MKEITYDDVISFESLRKAAKDCTNGVKWKSSTQMFIVNNLQWVATLHEQLENDTYKTKGFNSFTINERGKTRIFNLYISVKDVYKNLYVIMH